MKRGGDAEEKPCKALSAIFDEPCTLADRLGRRDSRVIKTLEDVAKILSAETVGAGAKVRFVDMTDQRAGKLLKSLLPFTADEEVGQAMKLIFAACLKELRQ